jgi:hypothetical protein
MASPPTGCAPDVPPRLAPRGSGYPELRDRHDLIDFSTVVEEDGGEVEEASDEAPVCAICKEPATAGGEPHTLPCSHTFHAGCVVRWFRHGSSSCPVCRAGLPEEEGAASASSSNDSEVTLSEGTMNTILQDHLRFGRRKTCPRTTLHKIGKYRQARQNLKERRSELYWHERTGHGRYIDLRRKTSRLCSRVFTAQASFYRRAMELLETDVP